MNAKMAQNVARSVKQVGIRMHVENAEGCIARLTGFFSNSNKKYFLETRIF